MPEDPRAQDDKAEPDAQHQDAPPPEEAGVPLERWSVERPFDSAEYLDRPEPEYELEEEAGVEPGDPDTLPPDPDPTTEEVE